LEVLSTIDLSEAQLEYIKNKVKNIHLTVVSSKDAANLPKEVWEKAEVLLTSGRNLPTREQAPALKWIQVSFAGVEHALEYPISSTPGVLLTSASGVRVSQLGEYALMALLALSHKLPKTIQAQREKKWLPNSSDVLIASGTSRKYRRHCWLWLDRPRNSAPALLLWRHRAGC
jgi:phosphoglycerate dehydrogenase-like enzyme